MLITHSKHLQFFPLSYGGVQYLNVSILEITNPLVIYIPSFENTFSFRIRSGFKIL